MRGGDFIIRVAKGKFRESYLSGFKLAERDAQPLIFVADTDLRPEGKHFLWHRERLVCGGDVVGAKIFRPDCGDRGLHTERYSAYSADITGQVLQLLIHPTVNTFA